MHLHADKKTNFCHRHSFLRILFASGLIICVSGILTGSFPVSKWLTARFQVDESVFFIISITLTSLGLAAIIFVIIHFIREWEKITYTVESLIARHSPNMLTGKDHSLTGLLDRVVEHIHSRIDFADTLMHTIPSAVIVSDFEGIIIQANSACSIMFCPDKEVVGSTLGDILANEYQNRSLVTMIRSASCKGSISMYWEGLCAGTIFPVFLQMQIIQLEGADFLLSVATDISDMKNAADEIFFRSSLLDNVFDSIIARQLDGTIVYANKVACQMHQYKMEEMIQLNAEDLVFPTSLVDYKTRITHLDKAGPSIFEIWHKRKNGTFVPVEASCVMISVTSESLIIETHHDLSEVKAGQHALRESEERFRSFFDNAKDSVFIATSNGFLLNINNAGRAFLGISDIDPKEVDLFSMFMSKHDRTNFINTMSAYGFVKDFQVDLQKMDGVISSVEINATFFHNPLYHITGYNGFIRDVTHDKLMEAQVRQSQKLDAIGRLAGGIAHDFNNILTIIIGNTEIALLTLNQTNQLYEPLKEIKDSAERAARLTTQLLAFSRKQLVQPEVFDPEEQLQELYKMLMRLIGEDINLFVQTQGGVSPIKADRNQFEQVIMNLVLNARDAILEKPNASERNIEIETRQIFIDSTFPGHTESGQHGPHIHIRVKDTGTGIPEENIDKIFDPFFTTKEPNKGTGLGLSIVFGVITQNNAQIHASSKIGEYTQFDIYWPCTTDSPKQEKEELVEPDKPSYGDEKILIVEDETSLCSFTMSALRRCGYDCISAANYTEASNAVKSHPDIDLAFIDIVIPGKDGITLARELSKSKPLLSILLTSGYPDVHIDAIEGATPWDMIQKPYNIGDLAKKIRQLLDKKEKG
jgi:PAS domain S-box-containing protein